MASALVFPASTRAVPRAPKLPPECITHMEILFIVDGAQVVRHIQSAQPPRPSRHSASNTLPSAVLRYTVKPRRCTTATREAPNRQAQEAKAFHHPRTTKSTTPSRHPSPMAAAAAPRHLDSHRLRTKAAFSIPTMLSRHSLPHLRVLPRMLIHTPTRGRPATPATTQLRPHRSSPTFRRMRRNTRRVSTLPRAPGLCPGVWAQSRVSSRDLRWHPRRLTDHTRISLFPPWVDLSCRISISQAASCR